MLNNEQRTVALYQELNAEACENLNGGRQDTGKGWSGGWGVQESGKPKIDVDVNSGETVTVYWDKSNKRWVYTGTKE